MSRASDLSGLITPKLVSVGGTSVGINSTSPVAELDVFGTIRADSFVKADGTAISGGGDLIVDGGDYNSASSLAGAGTSINGGDFN